MQPQHQHQHQPSSGQQQPTPPIPTAQYRGLLVVGPGGAAGLLPDASAQDQAWLIARTLARDPFIRQPEQALHALEAAARASEAWACAHHLGCAYADAGLQAAIEQARRLACLLPEKSPAQWVG